MRRIVLSLCGGLLIVYSVGLGAAQFLPADISRREAMEVFLQTAEIIKSEPVGEGVTAPWKLTLRKDGLEMKGVWKSIDTEVNGFPDHWHGEIAAYRLDKLLGLGLVPPVVEREFQGRRGDLSLWADSRYNLLSIMENNIAIPATAEKNIEAMKYLTRAWDCLIANNDRTQQNVLYTQDWRTILIDHSRAFGADREHVEKLIYGARGLKTQDDGAGGRRPILFRRLPRSFVEKVKGLDLSALKAVLAPFLTDREIEGIMARKKLLLDEIDGMIRENGEDKVLY
jgi:hypothetical protein